MCPEIGGQLDGEIGDQVEFQPGIAVPVEERARQREGHPDEDRLRGGKRDDGAGWLGHVQGFAAMVAQGGGWGEWPGAEKTLDTGRTTHIQR